MSDLFQDYSEAADRTGAYDEMFTPDQQARQSYGQVAVALRELSLADVSARADSMARTFLDRGVTFDFAGEERPFPLDIVPRVIPADEWSVLETGVAQRVRALEAFLNDVYDKMTVVADGVIPRQLVTTSAHFHRQVHGFEPAGGVRVHISGIDVVRDAAGTFRVLEDNVRVPSGVSYVLENRRAMAKGLPEAFGQQLIRPVEEYPRRLLSALRKTAPSGVDDPTVVVLTPGVFNSAYFEHTLLAGLMGVELVEGRDLICRGNRVYMRTTAGEQRVDVIYKRIDDEFLDPLQFRADSMLGCPGLVNAARAGGVTIANAVGNGVADDKLVYSYVPDLIRYYLNEEPVIANVDTFRLEEKEAREEVLDRLDELVVKPVDGSGGKGLVIGPDASRDELDALRKRVIARPPRLDRAAGPAAVHGADAQRRQVRPAARGPAPLRRQRRRRRLGSARRTDPGGAQGGLADRQLQPGRRFQGHLGAGGFPGGSGRRPSRARPSQSANGSRSGPSRATGATARRSSSRSRGACRSSFRRILLFRFPTRRR